MDGNNSKIPMTPPLPLRGTSPKGGSKGAEHHPQRGQREKAPLSGEVKIYTSGLPEKIKERMNS